MVIAAAAGVGAPIIKEGTTTHHHIEIEMITATLEEGGISLNHQEVPIVEGKMITEKIMAE